MVWTPLQDAYKRPVICLNQANPIHPHSIQTFALQCLFELAGGDAGHLFELAGEGTVVGVAAGQRNVGDGMVGL